MLRFQLHSPTCAVPPARVVLLALILIAACAPAHAGFIGEYALSNFTLTNTNADGTAFVSPDGSTLTLIGPNTGSGIPGTTDLTTVAKGTGLVQFQYSFSTLDIWDPSDPFGMPFDWAGYLINANFVELANQDGQSGTASFAVTLGQTFGFRAASEDNIGEPGILTISNFTAPVDGAAIPEPGTWSLLLAAGGAIFARHRMGRARKENVA